MPVGKSLLLQWEWIYFPALRMLFFYPFVFEGKKQQNAYILEFETWSLWPAKTFYLNIFIDLLIFNGCEISYNILVSAFFWKQKDLVNLRKGKKDFMRNTYSIWIYSPRKHVSDALGFPSPGLQGWIRLRGQMERCSLSWPEIDIFGGFHLLKTSTDSNSSVEADS